jgi:CubicO group peptidase (beta-lactamase class C family)
MRIHVCLMVSFLLVATSCDGGGESDEPFCKPEATKCDGNDVLRCNAGGTDWEFWKECDDDESCLDGECVERAQPDVHADTSVDKGPDIVEDIVLDTTQNETVGDVPGEIQDAATEVGVDGVGVDGVGVDTCQPSCDVGDPEEWYFPPIDPEDDDWEAVPPEALGWHTAELQELLGYLGQHKTTAVVLLYKGRILAEQYWQGWDPHTTAKVFSVSKSVIAFLVGRAQAQGLLDIDEYVTTYLEEDWSYALKIFESKVTVRHLLTMTSGLNLLLTFDGQAGTVWKYNTKAFKKLIAVLEAVTGVGIDEYTATMLYAPTGMRDTSWQQDKLSCSARDMARFGLMVLAGGQWDGQVLLEDPDYFAAMLDSSQELNAAYGYLWWLNGKDSWVLPDDTTGAGPIIPSAPADLVSAQGFGDKKIYVVPSMHLVLVRHGDAAGETFEETLSGFDDTLWQLLMAAAPAPTDGG